MASFRGFINNFSTQLNGAITNSATSIVVDDDTAINTILATTIDYVALTIDDGTNIEIIHCTVADGVGNLTVSRGEEGTSGTAFADNDRVQARLTKEGLIQLPEWQLEDIFTFGSAGSTLTFVFASTGTYKLVLDGVELSGAASIHFKQGTGGGPTIQSTGYNYGGSIKDNIGSTANQAAAATQVVVLTGATASATQLITGEIIIYNTDTSLEHSIKYDVRQLDKRGEGAAVRTTAEVVTGLQISTSTGNFAIGSRFLLYRRSN